MSEASFQEVAQSASIEEIYGYEEKPIDIDLGVTMRNTPAEQRVTMYKSMPGLYLDVRGRPVPDEMARAAGFDVEGDRKSARLAYEIRLASTAIRRRQEETEHEIRNRVSPAARAAMPSIPDLSSSAAVQPSAPAPSEGELVTETNANGRPRGTKDFVMVGGAGGFWDVVDRDSGVQMASKVITAKAEEILVDAQAKRNAG